MNPNDPRLQINSSGIGCWLTLLAIFLLLGSVGLGWLVKSFLIAIALIVIIPIVGWFGFRWWLRRNIIESQCPVCSYEFTGFNDTQCRCPSCGEPLKVEQGHFSRLTPPGTIDVEAVEVSVREIEE